MPHAGIIFIINSPSHLKPFSRNEGQNTCVTNIYSFLLQWKADLWPRGLRRGSATDGLFTGTNTAGGMDICL